MSLVIQPPRRVPMHYGERLRQELEKMKEEDITEGPINIEEPGTFLSNLVVADKKGTDRIRVTLDCQAVNKAISATHEPIPTPYAQHYLAVSDRISTLDMTNCYYQFEIEPSARKLYASALHGASTTTNVWLWGPVQLVVKSRNVLEKPYRIVRIPSTSRIFWFSEQAKSMINI